MQATFNNLPLYTFTIDQEWQSVDAVALVDKPAVKENFLMFNSQDRIHFSVDTDRRIISGVLMLADTPIFRTDPVRGDYYGTFSKDTIEQIAIKFFQENRQSSVNIMHDDGMMVDGVTMFESFITDKSRGVNAMAAFKDVPDGSWFGSFKVNNDEVWNQIKSGEFKGFSVQGTFDIIPESLSEIEGEIDALLSIL